MKYIIALLILASLSFAWTNDATTDMLDARYDYMVCNVDYAGNWLLMRGECASEHNVSVFDSSDYMDDLRSDLADIREAADEDDSVDFGINSLQLSKHSLDLLGALVVDALANKSLGFFACVRTNEIPFQENLADCRVAAMENERDASKQYVNNEIDYANTQIEELDAIGADTSGMEAVVTHAEGLVDDIDPAFDSQNPTEVRKLYLRHSRLLLLFRLEKMVSTIEYAKPIIEAGYNRNKEEILEKSNVLEVDTLTLIEECEYSSSISSPVQYSSQNAECWIDAAELFHDFNSIKLLILDGVL